ncbi:acetate/propionate family kinase [Derxia gummosa]|uniref:Acetate/propionate family kinase n=1 Tax=Derxia gummosa DSM 723 TaxID=1121388 RepID=A0AC36KGE5_9BURK|nr:acetate/propionate family kinase [Derxia gummosa]
MPAILVINAGSSSVKFAVFQTDGHDLREPAALHGQLEGIGGAPHLVAKDAAGRKLADDALPHDPAASLDTAYDTALAALLAWIGEHEVGFAIEAIGHRVVHGGPTHAAPVVVDDAVLAELDRYVPLAPLHQPHNLDAIRALGRIEPDAIQIACFDTAFHRSQPAVAQRFALPRRFEAAGVRRYGFHGLSYEYIAGRLPELLGERADGRVIVAHLGNGASLCALHGRRSVASTMGFSALDGLMMGTRTGAIDPGVLLYLLDTEKMDSARISRLLYKESGLLGVSGISADMRTLLASDAPEAAEAVELFCYRIAREIGSLAAALGGLDALVFTAGIGEHAAPVRERVSAACGWLGVKLDAEANAAGQLRLDAAGSAVAVACIPTDEEVMIARHALPALRVHHAELVKASS